MCASCGAGLLPCAGLPGSSGAAPGPRPETNPEGWGRDRRQGKEPEVFMGPASGREGDSAWVRVGSVGREAGSQRGSQQGFPEQQVQGSGSAGASLLLWRMGPGSCVWVPCAQGIRGPPSCPCESGHQCLSLGGLWPRGRVQSSLQELRGPGRRLRQGGCPRPTAARQGFPGSAQSLAGSSVPPGRTSCPHRPAGLGPCP